jgi:hypothetical protein
MGKFAQARQNDKSSLSEDTKLKIPVAKIPVGNVSPKMIAGEALNVNAVIKTRKPMMYFHFTLHPKARSGNKYHQNIMHLPTW